MMTKEQAEKLLSIFEEIALDYEHTPSNSTRYAKAREARHQAFSDCVQAMTRAPSPHSEEFLTVHDGYAMAALTGLLANTSVVGYNSSTGWAPVNCNFKTICGLSQQIGVHAMAARKATGASTPEGAAK